MSDTTSTNAEEFKDGEDKAKKMDSFFERWPKPDIYDPANCLTTAQLQEAAEGNYSQNAHLEKCRHCSSIVAALAHEEATREERLYTFMQAIRQRATVQAEQSFRRASIWQRLLGQLRTDGLFRFGAIAATAVILLALAFVFPDFRHSGSTSVSVKMPVQDQGNFSLVMEKMRAAEAKPAANGVPRHLAAQVVEINQLLRSININNLNPEDRAKLAEATHDLQIALNRRDVSNHNELLISEDLSAVNNLHERLASLPQDQLQEDKVDVVEIGANNQVVIKGPFKDGQLQPGSKVYKVLEDYAQSKQVDLDVRGLSKTTIISAAGFRSQSK